MKILNNHSNINTNLNALHKNSKKISSGKKINNAGDGASELAIIEKMSALMKSLDKGINNGYDMKNALQVADGGASSVTDGLARIRELSLSASSPLLTNDDKKNIQVEVDALLDGINDISNNTQFNGQNLLDGSFTNKNTAINSDGSGLEISINSTTTDALGLTGFSVIKDDIDFNSLDKAMKTVTTSSTKMGATMNRLDYFASSSQNALLNITSSKSKIEDADILKQLTQKQTNNALVQYGIFAEKNQMNTQRNLLSILL